MHLVMGKFTYYKTLIYNDLTLVERENGDGIQPLI
jgi:hypothetical protein